MTLNRHTAPTSPRAARDTCRHLAASLLPCHREQSAAGWTPTPQCVSGASSAGTHRSCAPAHSRTLAGSPVLVFGGLLPGFPFSI